MKLERMELHGFKSFSDRTEVVFPGGITAVVGPNGCGKSNLGDAINWVLGEQSARLLRGRQMTDVIFNGTRDRKPVGMAEVSLHFSGAEGLPHADQGKVTITRRLFRTGESDYLINGARSRLKDIQDLLGHARIGTKTYATIEQGKIDQVLNAKPKDRRLIIEEAAGIAVYKHKRRLTELKLEATQANLLRVHDIVLEVRRQINALKRQAAKARRYRRLRDELRTQEQLRFALRARALDAELAAGVARETDSTTAEAGAAAALARGEAAVGALRAGLDEARQAHAEAADRAHRLELEIGREESAAHACRERAAAAEHGARRAEAEAAEIGAQGAAIVEQFAAAREAVAAGRAALAELEVACAAETAALDALEQAAAAAAESLERERRKQFEIVHRAADAANRARSLEEAAARNAELRARRAREHAEARTELLRLEREAAALDREAELGARRAEEIAAAAGAIERRLGATREAHAAALARLTRAREAEQAALARQRTLEDVATRFAGVSDGVRMLLGAGAAAGVAPRGVLADFIEAPADVEHAAERYLQPILPSVILHDDDEVHRAAEFLRGQEAGRTWFLCGTQPAGALAVGTPRNGRTIPAEVAGDGRVRGRLRERLRLDTAANGTIDERIGDAILVDDLRTALELHRRYPAADYLTAEGDVVYASGLIAVGGRSTGGGGLLAHNRRTHEAAAEAAAAGSACATLEQELEACSRDLAAAEAEAETRRAEALEGTRQQLEHEHRSRSSREERERAQRRAQVLDEELDAARIEAEQLDVELSAARETATAAAAEARGLEQEVEARGAALRDGEATRREQAARVADRLAARAVERERLEALLREERRLERGSGELGGRAAELHAGARQERERMDAARAELGQLEVALAEHLREHERLRTALGEAERASAERQVELVERERELAALRQEHEAARGRTHAAELERERGRAAREHLDELCRQELGISAADAATAAAESIEGADPALVESGVAELRQRIEELGPVNMTAIEEFAELESRDEFLSAQKGDLEQSMESLRGTIGRINRQSRESFVEAFEAIRGSYQEIFKLLFSGGQADLRLEEGDEDVLERGVEILAQPPGKRLTGVHLLSGGEKAMSALALLFAVFRYQPAPFCVLDEVDAALDDVNVGRFTRLLREYHGETQFIVVTHNKLSMEIADLLYGVTMEEPGVSRLVSLRLQ